MGGKCLSGRRGREAQQCRRVTPDNIKVFHTRPEMCLSKDSDFRGPSRLHCLPPPPPPSPVSRLSNGRNFSYASLLVAEQREMVSAADE